MRNHYPLWKYLLLIVLIVLGLLYAAPNLYGEDFAVQVSAKTNTKIQSDALSSVTEVLQADNIPYLSATQDGKKLLIRFPTADAQLRAKSIIQNTLGDNYIVAFNLATRTPRWLEDLGAMPMKYGLDLRGGVHFLLDVDVEGLIQDRETGDMRSISQSLRKANIRYAGMNRIKPNGIVLRFRDPNDLKQAVAVVDENFPDYSWNMINNTQLKGVMQAQELTKLRNYAVEQIMTILTNRVNELGVSDAVVQRQGVSQISVDLPGVQDTTRAQDLIGKTATLKFQLVDAGNDAQAAKSSGNVPPTDQLYEYQDQPILLKKQVIARGSQITFANAGFDQNGSPAVNIRLGSGVMEFNRITGANVGQPMAVVYVETKVTKQKIDGKEVSIRTQDEQIINVATIQSALGNNFQIMGLDSTETAANLALLLRSGALAAPVNIIQSRTVGPSLGKANIRRGVESIIIGSAAVFLFMIFYYGWFGVIADLALILNIVLIVAVLSILGGTLTLPGIAGIVLTVGMAVDANVLINERVREELRRGMGIQASIFEGYARAFITIVDAHVTTLIVVVILFALGGSSSVKGFAITTIIGIICSMLTAIFFTRAIVNLIYGRKNVKRISIGISAKYYLENREQKIE